MTKISVIINLVPSSGQTTTTSVEVESAGASLGSVLRAAKIDPKAMKFSVDGEPATETTHVGPSSRVVATEKAKGS